MTGDLDGWDLGACPAQECGLEMLMDVQEMLIWMLGVALGGCKTILSKEVCAVTAGTDRVDWEIL